MKKKKVMMTKEEQALIGKMEEAINEVSEDATRCSDSREYMNAMADVIISSDIEGTGEDFMNYALQLSDSNSRYNFYKFICEWANPDLDAQMSGFLYSYCTSWVDDMDEAKRWLEWFGTENMLNACFKESEKAKGFYDSIPDIVTLYRGTCDEEAENKNYGISWTTDFEIAKFFAYRYGKDGRCVLKTEVNKKDIMSVLTNRKESEVIILNPINVSKVA